MNVSLTKFFRSTFLLIYMAAAMLPVLSRNIGNTAILFLAFMLMVTSVSAKMKIQKDIVLLFCIHVFLLSFQYWRVSETTAIGNLYENLLFVLPIFYYAINEGKRDNEGLVLATFYILQTYVALENIVILSKAPYLSKYLTGGVYYVVSEYKKTNLGTVTNVFLSACLCLFTIVVYKKCKSKMIRFLIISSFAINLTFVLLAKSMLCILLLIIGSFILVNNKKTNWKFIMVMSVTFLFLVFCLFSSSIRNYVSRANIANEYKRRILDIIDLVTGSESVFSLETVGGRFSDYYNSLRTFVFNPFLGAGMIYSTDVSVVGMHSEVFDFMARYGIIGLLIFCYMVKRYYSMEAALNSRVIKSLMLVFFIYMILNPVISRNAGIVFFWIIPYIVRLRDLEDNSDIICSE